MATEQDLLETYQREGRLCELVDGILVAKAMGLKESSLAGALLTFLRLFVVARKLGTVTAPDGIMRLAPGVVRIPDVAFIPWDRLPNRRLPDEPLPTVVPDLAVEILSPSHTNEEMGQKLRDYFNAGCRLVWFVDPAARTVTAYTSPDQFTVYHEEQTLDGGLVRPGFALPLCQLFAELDPQ